MHLSEVKPTPALSAFVRLYRIIDFEFHTAAAIPPKAYTPRPEQCLQFFPSPTKIAYPDDPESFVRPKNALIIGQHTVHNSRTVYKKFLSVQVVFQPGALYRLCDTPLTQFTNRLTEAGDVVGPEISLVNEQLFNAKHQHEMIAIVERFLLTRLKLVKKDLHPIDKVAQLMLNPDKQMPLDWYINNAFLSNRQFDRKFADRMGISPKEYLRVIRFDHAYRMKNCFPQMSWFNVAIACGYYDYQHLSKDYQDFTGYTPTRFFAIESPERLLGTEEVY